MLPVFDGEEVAFWRCFLFPQPLPPTPLPVYDAAVPLAVHRTATMLIFSEYG